MGHPPLRVKKGEGGDRAGRSVHKKSRGRRRVSNPFFFSTQPQPRLEKSTGAGVPETDSEKDRRCNKPQVKLENWRRTVSSEEEKTEEQLNTH